MEAAEQDNKSGIDHIREETMQKEDNVVKQAMKDLFQKYFNRKTINSKLKTPWDRI